MERDTVVSDRILDDMTDGVVAIDLSGNIITFNPAAARILGIAQEEALAKSFGEVFLLAEENDDFNQTILDAIYESSISHNRIVNFTNNGKCSTLALTTTFLRSEDGTGEKIGIIAVFNDITELTALQETEARLAEELKTRHAELQAAYLKTEEGNQQLQAALKKVQIIRISATAFTILLFLGIGLFVWNRKPYISSAKQPSGAEAGKTSTTTITVTPQPVSTSISLTGKLLPLQMVNLTSPISGKVAKVMVHYGEVVKAGQPLATMDISEALIKHREAKAAHIKALTSFRQMEKWETSSDVARAHRSLAKAKMSLKTRKRHWPRQSVSSRKGSSLQLNMNLPSISTPTNRWITRALKRSLKLQRKKGTAITRKYHALSWIMPKPD